MKLMIISLALALNLSWPALSAPSRSEIAKNRAEFATFMRHQSADLAIPMPEMIALFTLSVKYDVNLDELIGGLHETGSAAHDGTYGRNVDAANAMAQLGIKVTAKDGSPLIGEYIIDLADSIHRQKDPYTKHKICLYLGCTSILPILDDGGDQIRALVHIGEERGLN